MVTYICFNCGETIELELDRGIRCPFCGGRVILKKRPELPKTVKAR